MTTGIGWKPTISTHYKEDENDIVSSMCGRFWRDWSQILQVAANCAQKHRSVMEGCAPCLHEQRRHLPDCNLYVMGVSASMDRNCLIPFPHISGTWQELRHWSSRRNWTSFCWLLLMNHYHLVTQLVVELHPTAYCTWYLLVVNLHFVFDGVP